MFRTDVNNLANLKPKVWEDLNTLRHTPMFSILREQSDEFLMEHLRKAEVCLITTNFIIFGVYDRRLKSPSGIDMLFFAREENDDELPCLINEYGQAMVHGVVRIPVFAHEIDFSQISIPLKLLLEFQDTIKTLVNGFTREGIEYTRAKQHLTHLFG